VAALAASLVASAVLYADEQRNYDEAEGAQKRDHVFRSVKEVAGWLDQAEAAEAKR
jgi:hypothetical protein